MENKCFRKERRRNKKGKKMSTKRETEQTGRTELREIPLKSKTEIITISIFIFLTETTIRW